MAIRTADLKTRLNTQLETLTTAGAAAAGGTGTGGGQHPFFNEEIFADFFSGFGDDFSRRFNFTQGPGRTRTFRSSNRGNRQT